MCKIRMWLLYIFTGLIACTGKSDASCQLKMIPPAVVVKYGDPLSANCTSLSNNTEGIGWESSAGGTGLQDGVTSLDLKIKSITEWDFKPKCYINYLDGKQCLEALPVTVYKPPDTVSLSLLSHAGPMLEGNKYTMLCNITNVAPVGNLFVYWHKGNKIIHTETFSESTPTPVSKSSSFNLMAHGDDDGIEIWCEAKLNLKGGPDRLSVQSKSHHLIVRYAPVFAEPANETVEVSPHSELTLNCTAAGNPMPFYKWESPQVIIENSEKEDKPILAKSFYISGTYSCTAFNLYGTKTKYFTVTETQGNRTTFAAIVGVGAAVGVLLLIAGLLTVTPNGTFSFKQDYLRAPSGPV